MSSKRIRRSLSYAAVDNDTGTGNRRKPTSTEKAKAAALAAQVQAQQQAELFESLDEAAGYCNWFPRQTGFNALSKTQINKDLRDLTAATHAVPYESDDEDIDEHVYSLYDASASTSTSSDTTNNAPIQATEPRKTPNAHPTPDVLQDIWSNELLYYRWRIQKRTLEMHEILGQRRVAWETYVALRASLVEEIRRFAKQRTEQQLVLAQLTGSRDKVRTKAIQVKAQVCQQCLWSATR